MILYEIAGSFTCFSLFKVSENVPADVALSVVSDIGCCLSIIGLSLTIASHLYSRSEITMFTLSKCSLSCKFGSDLSVILGNERKSDIS